MERLQQDYPGHEIPLDSLVEAFVEPAITLSADKENGGAVFLCLLGRSYTESSVMLQKAISKMYGSVIDRFREAFTRVLPGLPSDGLYWRMHFMVGLVAYLMSGTDMMCLTASCRINGNFNADMAIKRLRVFLSAGMQAPLRKYL